MGRRAGCGGLDGRWNLGLDPQAMGPWEGSDLCMEGGWEGRKLWEQGVARAWSQSHGDTEGGLWGMETGETQDQQEPKGRLQDNG